MEHLPTGSILLVVLIDIGLVCGLSAAFGAAIARAGGSRSWVGAVVGAVLPVIGPSVWLLVVVVRDASLLVVRRRHERDPRTWASMGLLVTSAIVFVAGTFLAWGSISGDYQGYSLASDASPADSTVGAVATVGSALLLGSLVVVGMLCSARRRLGVVAGLVAGTWLLVTLDGLVVISALDGIAADVSGVSGGRATVDAAAAGGLWACLLAALLALAGALGLVAGPAASAGGAIDSAPGRAGESAAPSWGGSGSWQTGVTVPPGGPGSTSHDGWGTPASQWGEDDREGRAW